MTRILDQVIYKDEVVEHIRKIFPNTEWRSNEKESWVEVKHKEKECRVSFSGIRGYIMYAISTEDVALDMMSRVTKEIIKEKQS